MASRTRSEWRLGLVVAMAAAVARLGCSSDPTPAENAGADAGAPVSTAMDDAHAAQLVDRVAGLAASDPVLTARLAPNPEAWQAEGDWLTSPGWRGARSQRAHHVGARLPLRAAATIEVGVGVSELYRLRLSPEGARSVPVALDRGRAVFADAYPSTDVVFVAEPERIEWMYQLRDESAPTEFSYQLELPAKLPSAGFDASGALEIYDEAGTVQLRMPRPHAVDAAGQRRDAELRFDGEKLTVAVDTTGLEYPVLLDPAIEVAVWVLRQTQPVGRTGSAMVWDDSRRRLVMFGGQNLNYLRDTWEWDGAVWSLRATTGPSGRRDFAMAYDISRSRIVLYGGSSPSPSLADTWEWDGYMWTQVCTSAACSSTTPGIRGEHAMVFHPGIGKVVLFGGRYGGTYYGDTWTWDGTNWKDLAITGPSARASHSMAYDVANTRTVLFGGRNGATEHGDTWSFNGTSWGLVTTSGPPARYGASMAYSGIQTATVLFGGYDGSSSYYNDYLWTLSGTTWNQSFATPPPARSLASSGYDVTRRTFVVFGGTDGTVRNDLWEFVDGMYWRKTLSYPDARAYHSAAYDTQRSRFIVFGGTVNGIDVADTWEWTGAAWNRACADGSCGPSARKFSSMAYDTDQHVALLLGGPVGDQFYEYDGAGWWTQLCTTAPCSGLRPVARMQAALAYDSARKRTVLFGGADLGGTPLGDTWLWNQALSAWTQACTTSPCNSKTPAPRTHHAMAFDENRGRVVLFGGKTTTAATNETWEWTGNAWIQQFPAKSPPARTAHQMVYDPVRQRVVLFGGSGTADEDVWEWDGSVWQAFSATGPGRRSDFGMAFDTARQRAVLFGGIAATGGTMGDTWEYYTRGAFCSNALSCPSGYCTDQVCCESLSCGTCQACDTAANPGVCSPVTNAEDPDSCPAATSMCDAQGQCRLKTGQSCTLATQCASGYCADGYCCDVACSGGCDVCNATPGTCTPLAAGSLGSNPTCSGFLCDGVSGACPTSCSGDDQCATTHFCASDGTCQPRRPQGAGCNTDAGGNCQVTGCRECAPTLTCADYLCCSSACTGTCRRCNAAGVCDLVTLGEDPDTCSGTSICDGSGTCGKKLGETCASAGECASGYCANGVCCQTACAGGCSACNIAGNEGTCLPAPQGAVGSPSCSPYVCNGSAGSCPGSCAGDSDCVSTHYCSAGGTCLARKSQGATCDTTAGGDCSVSGCRVCGTAGGCIDGYCCNTTCGAACDACDGAARGWSGASNGSCAVAPAGFAGTPSCGAYACNGTSVTCASSCSSDIECGSGYYCAAGGNCLPQKGTGQSCNLTADCQQAGCRECASGNCVDGFCCNAACSGPCDTCSATPGTCSPSAAGSAGTPTCSPYLCNGASASCPGNCTADNQCASGYYCRTSDQSCQPVQAQGGACTSTQQCQAGLYCVDGVCCDAPCTATCQACSNAKTGAADGTCAAVLVDTDPDDDCVADAQTTCGQTGFCNGTGACKLWGVGTTCGASTCASGQQSGLACDGSGNCVSGSTTACAPYTCANASVCATSCSDDSGCVAAYFCDTSSGGCAADLSVGAACTRAAQCASGNCVDGFCCDAPCSGACLACSAAKKGAGSDGVCGAVADNTDPDNDCAAESTSSCGQTGMCNGAGGCKLHPPGTSCGSTTCSGGVQTGYQCDGFGVCEAGSTSSCSPYFCADANVCASSCSSDAECVTSAFCDTNTATCKSDQVNGQPCTAGSQCVSGFCVDGVCCAQACDSLCQACSVALKGSGNDGECGNIAAGTDPGSECSDEGANSCGQNGYCNGFGACQLYVSGTVCGATTCSAGTQTGYTCNGSGSCGASGVTVCAPYVCQGSACGTQCVADADCVSSHYCNVGSGTCDPDLPVGEACTAATQCASGNCVDGVCCDAPCTGVCRACSLAKTGVQSGTCADVTVGSDPDDECSDDGQISCQRNGLCGGNGACQFYAQGTVCGSTTCTAGSQSGSACDGLGACQTGQATSCGLFVCQGNACGVTCASDTDCIASAFCATDSTCKADQANGAACASGSQCTSGFCVDGVCCDQACDGLCEACSAAKKGGATAVDGVCGAIVPGSDPDNECTAESPSTCGQDGTCNGSGQCALHGQGTSCGSNTCGGTTGSTLTGQQCDGFGVCVPGTTTQCDPYTCLGTSCLSVCGSDDDCVSSAYCDTTTAECKPKQANGQACISGNQCTSTFCVEGVCCDTACNGICQACTGANKDSGADGVCGLAKSGVDPHGDCEPADVTTCGRDGECDGSGACRLWASGKPCGDTACEGNVQTGYACTGTGLCDPNTTSDCLLFGCQAGACLGTCAADADCAPEAYCDEGTGECLAKLADGEACSDPATCVSGFCVDGVCCDQACGGQCEACDVETAVGKCSPVVGPPHEPREPCAEAPGTSPDEICQARACDGTKDRASCVGYVGSGQSCRDRACENGVATFSATCNGTGTCGAAGEVETKPCEPFACGTDACKNSCATEADCAEGYKCDTASNKCISGSFCQDDHTAVNSQGTEEDCSPFKCEDVTGQCVDRCTSTNDCVSGTVCNDDRLCVSASGGSVPEDEGGCGCRSAGGKSSGPWVLLGLALGMAALRRRRGGARPVSGPER